MNFIKFLTVLFAICLASCGSGEGSAINSNESTPSPDILTIPVFPHPEGWADPEIHGKWINKFSNQPCFSCHKTTSDENEVIPACGSCHALYPHTQSWSDSINHGSDVIQSGIARCATKCHGADLSGGLSEVSCTRCHGKYPHSDNWHLAEEHGKEAKGDGKLACKGCHGGDYNGGDSKKSCYECHADYPHSADWGIAAGHGQFVNNNGKERCATKCHGADLAGGISLVSCTSCHTVFPHNNQWENEHGALAKANKTVCQYCHGVDFKRVLNGKNCFSCHPAYPHISGFAEHGAYVLTNSKEECRVCHGMDYLGGSSQKSCKDANCHPSYPHNSPGWVDNREHAELVLGDLDNDKTSCKLCHAEDLAGGNTHVSCQGCHENFRHNDPNWSAQGRGSVHALTFINKIKNGETNACTECHGANYDQPINGVQCTNNQCHPAGVTHKADWAQGPQHGIAYSNFYNSSVGSFRTSNCSHCHGEPIVLAHDQTRESLTNQSSCYSCHLAYPHPGYMSTEGPWWNIWTPAANGDNELAHRSYLGDTAVVRGVTQSELFMDALGARPPLAPHPVAGQGEDYDFVPALQNTCGGSTANACHFDGNRSRSPRFGGGLRGARLCASYCHRP